MDTTHPARFVRRFCGTALGAIGLVAALNLVVDPWNRFGLNRLGVYVTASREYVSTEVGRYPHDALLMGNSRTAGLPASRIAGARFFNASFEGASLVEIRIFLERHLRAQKLVVLNLDPYLLGPESDAAPSAVFGRMDLRAWAGYLASTKALEYSLKTMADGLAGKVPTYAPDGTMESENWRRQRDVDDPAWSARQMRIEAHRLEGFRFGPKRRDELAAMVGLVRERGARLVCYLSPIHEELLPALRHGESGAAWREAVGAVRGLIPDLVDLTDGPYSAGANFYRTDPVHFHPEVGLRFLVEAVLPRGGADGSAVHVER